MTSDRVSWLNVWNWRLSTKLVVAMASLAILPLIVVIFVINTATASQIGNQVGDNLKTVAQLEGKRIGAIIAQQIRQTIVAVATDPDVREAVAASNATYSWSEEDIRHRLLTLDSEWQNAPEDGNALINHITGSAVSAKLRHYVEQANGHMEVFVTDRYGAEVAASGRTSDFYQADEAWWQSGWNNGKGAVHIDSPEFDESARVVALSFAIPVTDAESGEVIGVLKNVYNITAVIAEIQTFQLGTSGQMELIDANGNYVAGRSRDVVGMPVDPTELLNGQIFGASGYQLDLHHDDESITFGFAPVTSNGLVPELDQLGWVTVFEQDSSEALATITQLRGIVGIITLAVVVIAAAIAYIISRVLTQGLSRLSEASRLFGAGNLDARADIQSGDEIGEMAASFNHMAAQLNQLVNELKTSVFEAEAARHQAEQADKVKSAFLASMSHELRTPLNAVINYTKFVVRGMMGPVTERQTETLNKVVNSATHLLNLINDVLDISKIESGSLQLFVEKDVDLKEILSNVAMTAETLIVDKPVTLHQEVEPDLPLITGDRQRLYQVLLNIVSNACKFTEEGQITVRACRENGDVVLTVQDTGLGIAPEDHTVVFEPFKQTATGLRHGGGTGLGMPITKSLVEAHGGRIWLDSALGQGTTFYVALPVESTELIPTIA